MRRRPSSTALAIALLACLGGCGEPDPPPEFPGFADDVVLQSEHFRLHFHADDPDACPAALDELERHRDVLTEYLGVSPKGIFDYYKFESVEELRASTACNTPNAPACVHGARIASSRLFDAHELIHAYVGGATFPPWIIIEGLADVLSCGYGPWSRARDYANFEQVSALGWQDLAAWVPSAAVSDLTYYRAGAQLVRYLVESSSIADVMGYYRSARSSSDPSVVDADFQSAFGQSLADAWQAALELELPGGPCLTPFECSLPALALDDAWTISDSCGVGYHYRTLELAEATSLLLSAPGANDRRGDRDSQDMLFACDGLKPAPFWSSFMSLPLATHLEPGTYALVLSVPEGDIEVSVAPAPIATDCAAALTSPLPIDSKTLRISLPRTGDAWYAGVSAPGGQLTEVQGSQILSPSATLCPACDPEQECPSVTTGRPSFELGTGSVLGLETDSHPTDFAEFTLRPQP